MTLKVRSMTGFGSAELTSGTYVIKTVIRSLNGKFYDLDLRMPRTLNTLEPELRVLVQEKMERGTVSVQIALEKKNSGAESASLSLNKEIALHYKNSLQDLASYLEIDFTPSDLIKQIVTMPEVFTDAPKEPDTDLLDAVKQSVVLALENLEAFRLQEGQKLGVLLLEAASNIRAALVIVEAEEVTRRSLLRQRLWDALITQMEEGRIDRNRFEQEVILYIEKLDIAEEKNRLKQHLDYFTDTLQQNPSGKKLSFIAQEMGREINTLGVKSNHFPMQQAAVDMKEQLEQIKEQVLNLM